jgi:hypothetical protein
VLYFCTYFISPLRTSFHTISIHRIIPAAAAVVIATPKSVSEIALSMGLSADSVQSALSIEILKFVAIVDAQEANLHR